jgi:hypothetical protein
MNKLGMFIIAGFFSMTTLGASITLTQAQQDTIATQCKPYLTNYPALTDMPADVAKTAAPLLLQCYKNYSCTQNAELLKIHTCKNNLSAWYAQYTASAPASISEQAQDPVKTSTPVVPAITPIVAPEKTAPEATATPQVTTTPEVTTVPEATAPTPKKTVPEKKAGVPHKSSINWF